MLYRIKIAGVLDSSWSDWLGNVNIALEPQMDGSVISTLTLDATDQSTLFGVLDRIRDLNIALITVTRDEVKKEGDKK